MTTIDRRQYRACFGESVIRCLEQNFGGTQLPRKVGVGTQLKGVREKAVMPLWTTYLFE
jgi:hypothetical protein